MHASLYVSMSLPLCLSVSLTAFMSLPSLSVCLSLSVSVSLSLYLSLSPMESNLLIASQTARHTQEPLVDLRAKGDRLRGSHLITRRGKDWTSGFILSLTFNRERIRFVCLVS